MTGKAKTALITATGTHTRRCVTKKDRTAAPRPRRRRHSAAASTTEPITGTKNRKLTCP